jgi:hypothetical protein
LILGAIPAELDEKGQLKESWDGEWFTVGDGQTELVCPISDFEELNDNEDTYLAEVPAQVRFKGTNQWFDVSLYFYLDFNDEEVAGEFIYAFESTKSGPREIQLESGDEVRPVYLSYDARGNEQQQCLGQQGRNPSSKIRRRSQGWTAAGSQRHLRSRICGDRLCRAIRRKNLPR